MRLGYKAYACFKTAETALLSRYSTASPASQYHCPDISATPALKNRLIWLRIGHAFSSREVVDDVVESHHHCNCNQRHNNHYYNNYHKHT